MKQLLLALGILFSSIDSLCAQTPSPSNEAPQSSQLISPDSGVDYTLLQQILSNQQWQRANNKTAELLLKAAGRLNSGWADVDSIQRLPCWDIATVEQLWQEYSYGRFGLTTQFPLFIQTGNQPGRINSLTYEAFASQVGWRDQNRWIGAPNLIYSLNAPRGHLPVPYRSKFTIYGGNVEFTTYFKKALECGIINY